MAQVFDFAFGFPVVIGTAQDVLIKRLKILITLARWDSSI